MTDDPRQRTQAKACTYTPATVNADATDTAACAAVGALADAAACDAVMMAQAPTAKACTYTPANPGFVPGDTDTVRAHPERLRTLCVPHRAPVLCGGCARARRALHN